MIRKRELIRKVVHIGAVVFALLIGRLSPTLISLCCLVAFVNNWLVLPRLTGGALERDADKARGWSIGMLIYPAVLFALSLVFFQEQIYLAVAWGVMAFGDGFAELVGKTVRGPRLSWNTDKSWSGFLACFLFGGALTWGLIMLLPEASRLGFGPARWGIAIFFAALAAALAETQKGTVDDNLVVPIVAAVVAFVMINIPEPPMLPMNWRWGMTLVILLTTGSIMSGKIDISGGMTGGLLAWLIFLGGGMQGLSLLFAFFVLGTLASRWRVGEKERLGLAQENRGTRSIRHAVSNGGTAAICGLIAWILPVDQVLFQAMIAASLASATADTLSSELGNVYGKHFVNAVTFRPDQRGLDGVISLEGTVIGALGSLLIALLYALPQPAMIFAVTMGGVFGNIIDSILGATLQRRGYMTNDSVNFANTLAAAGWMAAASSLASWV